MSIRPQHQIVAEIFTDVGVAFTRLGELETLLSNSEHDEGCSVSETDILASRMAIVKFGTEINKICQRIRERTLAQIRNSMKRHAYEEAGLPLRKQQVLSAQKSGADKLRVANSVMAQSTGKSADITLNMLNATEQEGDDNITNKLQFNCSGST